MTEVITYIPIGSTPHWFLASVFPALLGAVVGAFAAYLVNKRLGEIDWKKKTHAKAYSAASLIRFWLYSGISALVNLRMQLEDKKKILDKGISDKNNREWISVCQAFLVDDRKTTVDKDLIKDLCLKRECYKTNLEQVLQHITFAENQLNSALEIKNKFNLLRQYCFGGPENRDILPDLQGFVDSFIRNFSDWIDVIQHHESIIKKVYAHFQDNVCTPLNLQKMECREIDTVDKIINESTP